ncbi:hypothetical protein PRIEUP_LOCUS2, partial [Pristimantis euphronides]
MIGFLMNNMSETKSRLQFENRLQFNQKNCSFLLMNLTEQDSNVYTFITRYPDKKDTEQRFNVTVTGRITPMPPVNNSSHNHEDNISGKKCRKKYFEEPSPHLHQISLLEDPFQHAANSAFDFGEYFSLVFQLVGTILFLVWKVDGQSVFWPICSTVSLIVKFVMVMIKKEKKKNCSRCHGEDLQDILGILIPCWSFLTTSSIVVAFFLTYPITQTWMNWFLVAAVMSLCIRAVLIGVYCK